MSILIHMEMPLACGECPFEHDHMYICRMTGSNTFDSRSQWERMPNCPLIELPPHGDLIDREKIPFVEAEYACDDYAFRYDINEMTPVIPAEEE